MIVQQYLQKALHLARTVYILNHGEMVHVGSSGQLDTDENYERYLGIETADAHG